MSQDQWIILLLKVSCLSGFLSLTAWVVIYSFLAPWWRNPIGRTLVAKTALVALLLVPTALSLFLHFNRLTSHIAAWIDVGLIGLITPVMIWRSVVWVRLHKAGRLPADGQDG